MDLTESVQHIFASYGFFGLYAIVAFEAFQFVFSTPIGPIIVFLGGLASQGAFSVLTLWLVVYAGVVTGDNLGFLVGRKFGQPILHRFGTKLVKKEMLEKAEKTFSKYGAVAIFFTRFIFATIAAPLNVLAGASDLPWRRYIVAEMGGQIVWTSLYVFLGYFFGKQVEQYIRVVDDANITILSLSALIIILLIIWILGRGIHQHVQHRKRLRHGNQ
ncbi:MAG: DedA family protein [Patescibacteria group bacterium]|jgi:membrane-associated protein